ncbi:patatin-like phospholipase family protein [Saccharicrinis aurantiacus]|uniref:patatin-like phospholipase family protein n=1 Tax=Saccharicrinis aurantiacus TaxID=1849719 RepID=UPI000838CEE6|nr:patatin-like phospholipase family protein [Saccharicrinis aurantiacus]
MSKNVALVLSSGGARGISHIGVIEKIIELGYNITSISGTSIGALIGGLYVAGHMDDYKKWVCSLGKGDVFSLMDFQLKSEGIIKGNKVFNHMEQWLNKYNIEDLDIPFSAVASDILNREEIVFTSGNLSDAIRASVAVPGFLAPFKRNDQWLFDGGVINPIPLNRVERREGDMLVAVDLNAFVPNRTDLVEKEDENPSLFQSPRLTEMMNWFNQRIRGGKDGEKLDISYVNLMTQMFDMMQEQISKTSIAAIKPDVLIKIPRDICSTFEFHKSKEMIKLGYETATEAFSKIDY